MYTIQETATQTGLSTHTLRYYEKSGLLRPIARNKSGHRAYSEDDIGWVKFLLCLRNTGMSIQKVQSYLKLERQGNPTNKDRCDLLESHRADVLAHIESLKDNLRAIDNKIAHYEALE